MCLPYFTSVPILGVSLPQASNLNRGNSHKWVNGELGIHDYTWEWRRHITHVEVNELICWPKDSWKILNYVPNHKDLEFDFGKGKLVKITDLIEQFCSGEYQERKISEKSWIRRGGRVDRFEIKECFHSFWLDFLTYWEILVQELCGWIRAVDWLHLKQNLSWRQFWNSLAQRELCGLHKE